MEKVNFKNSSNLNLVGVFYSSDSNSVIIISHGFAANKDRKRLIKLAESLNKNGFAVLRFDFRASGESDEDSLSIEKEVDDLNSAIKFVKSKGYNNIGLLGESLGGLVSLKAYNEEIKSVVLWAPVTKAGTPEIEKDVRKKGFILKEKDNRIFKIDKKYIEERKSINQKGLLSRIKCPVLIIHGSNDETIPLEDSKSAIKFCKKGSKLEIIEGASHKLEEEMEKVISLSADWFTKNTKRI